MTQEEYTASYMSLMAIAKDEGITEFNTCYELACKLLARYNRYYKYADIPNVFNDQQQDIVRNNWASIRNTMPEIREYEKVHGAADRGKIEKLKQEFDENHKEKP